MFAMLKQILAPPDFGDEEKNRLAGIVNAVVLTLLVAIVLSWLSILFVGAGTNAANTNLLLGISLAGSLLALGLVRRGRYVVAGLFIALLVSGVITYSIFSGSTGLRTHLLVVYLATAAVAGFIAGRRGLVGMTLLNLALIVGLFLAEAGGLLALVPLPPIGAADLVTILIVLALPTVTLYLLFSQNELSLGKLQRNAQVLTETNRQLQAIRASLEEEVAERTQGLVTVTTINERLSAILDLNQLLAEVVNEVRDRFDYYHAHIYLLDEGQQNLVVAEGTGAAGAALKEKQHSIPVHAPTSLVARAARSGQIVNVENVREAPDWLPNDLLPDTYSEIAVPIVVDNQAVGVLDVQDDQVAGFDEGDENVLRALANQVAVAIRNARLFADVEQALADVRAAQRRYLEEAWEAGRIAEVGGFHLAIDRALSLPEAVIRGRAEQGKQVAIGQQLQALVPLDADEAGRQMWVSPIKLQDLVVGTVSMQPSAGGGPLQADELAAIEAVLAQFSQMAETMRLTDVNRRRANREQTIRQVTEKMRAADSLEELVETTAKELGDLFSGDYTTIELGVDPRSGYSGGNAQWSFIASRPPGRVGGVRDRVFGVPWCSVVLAGARKISRSICMKQPKLLSLMMTLAVMGLFLLAGCSQQSSQPAEIKIGVIAPITGGYRLRRPIDG